MNLKHKTSSNQVLAISIGVVYLWFGTLKYFPGVSPAEGLAQNTISALTFNLIPSSVSIILLAILESLVGLLLILNVYRRGIVVIALIHIVFTFTPLFLFPKQVFVDVPFQLSLLGQYIIKNFIIVSALLILYNSPTTKPKLH